MATYRTRDGDVLDAIARAHYGPDRFSVEAVYDANPGLAKLGPVLPSGVLIDLPDEAAVTPSRHPIRLWD